MKNFENKKFTITDKKNREFQMEFLTKAEEVKRPDFVNLLNSLVEESETHLSRYLEKEGAKLKQRVDPKKAWKVKDQWLDEWEKENRVASIITKDGQAVATIVFMINNESERKRLGIQGDFAMFIKAICIDEFRESGILTKCFGITHSLIQSNLSDPTYIACVTNKKIIKDNQEINKVMNLNLYADFWEKLFDGADLQIRYTDQSGEQFGYEKVNYSLAKDDNFLQKIIKEHEEKAKQQDKSFLGFYIHSKKNDPTPKL